jgi:hypothetical protein
MPFFFGSEHSGVACFLVGDAGAAADVAAAPLAAPARAAATGVSDDRAPTLAAAGPAIPNIINMAATTAPTILRRSLGAFRVGSTEILQQTCTGDSLSPETVGDSLSTETVGDSPRPDGIRLDPRLTPSWTCNLRDK